MQLLPLTLCAVFIKDAATLFVNQSLITSRIIKSLIQDDVLPVLPQSNNRQDPCMIPPENWPCEVREDGRPEWLITTRFDCSCGVLHRLNRRFHLWHIYLALLTAEAKVELIKGRLSIKIEDMS